MKDTDWTAEDVLNGGLLVKDGHLWNVTCVHFDGTVEATCVETIKPSERSNFKLVRYTHGN